MKSILFNTDMVRAILDNRKTVTRRVVKPQPEKSAHNPYGCVGGRFAFRIGERACTNQYKPPYRPGDILYVRETWRVWRARRYEADVHIEFKAGGDGAVLRFSYGGTDSANRKDYDKFFEKWGIGTRWHPSIHMPREAARIFLRVTDVRVERLQDICGGDLLKEGIDIYQSNFVRVAFKEFEDLWNATIKKADRAIYGWDANPWVWVIEFERISREEDENHVI